MYIIKCAIYLPYIKMMQRRRMMDGAYITHGMGQMLKNYCQETRRKDQIEDPGVDGMLVFKLI
jgi:hypothetical protein